MKRSTVFFHRTTRKKNNWHAEAPQMYYVGRLSRRERSARTLFPYIVRGALEFWLLKWTMYSVPMRQEYTGKGVVDDRKDVPSMIRDCSACVSIVPGVSTPDGAGAAEDVSDSPSAGTSGTLRDSFHSHLRISSPLSPGTRSTGGNRRSHKKGDQRSLPRVFPGKNPPRRRRRSH